MHTAKELKRLQALPLDEKIALSKLRIAEWYEHWQGKVCVSYSGGKDSTVLLKLVRELYPDVPAVYADTRLDFPEIREFVKATENVIWLKPEMNFREVIDTYGYCYPSKAVAHYVAAARRDIKYAKLLFEGKKADGSVYPFYEQYYTRWKWLIDAPLKISDKCCAVMKEKPIDSFVRKNKLHPYVGLLAEESNRRKTAWIRTGCNSFKSNKSKPLSFWTEQDILRYLVDFNIKIPSVYGEIVEVKGILQTTGEKRTGCVFCPIGAHLESPNKFQRLQKTHPDLYRYCMNALGLDEFLTTAGVAH